MPIIFALSILLFPQMIVSFLARLDNATVQSVSQMILNILNNQWVYAAAYFILVFAFTYFYSAITFDPESLSNNLQKSGAFIPGIRPGRPTAEYVARSRHFRKGSGALLELSAGISIRNYPEDGNTLTPSSTFTPPIEGNFRGAAFYS
jgi:preprotein translocase subunit SecY